MCAETRNIFNYYHLFLASIKNKHGNFCPEKCQTNFNCKTDNLVCPTCQDGWGGPYCHRKFLIAVSNNLAAYFFKGTHELIDFSHYIKEINVSFLDV